MSATSGPSVADEVCPVCHAKPPEPPAIPGAVAFGLSGVWHESDCPTVPGPSIEQRRALVERLKENDRARRNALATARSVVVGGRRG